MTDSTWNHWWVGRQRKSKAHSALKSQFVPRLEPLETLIVPALSVSNLSVTPTTINEGQAVSLKGQYSASNPIGQVNLSVDWGDGSAVQSIPLTTFGNNISFGPVNHVYLDDNPSGTASDGVGISVSIVDTGPSQFLTGTGSIDQARYRVYDVPWWNIDLQGALNLNGAASGVVTVLASGNNDDTAGINLAGNTFRFYGQTVSSVTVSDNGLIYLAGSSTQAGNTITKTATRPSAISQAAIAPFGDDLRQNDTPAGRVLTRFLDFNGDGVSDYLIVEWIAAHANNAGGNGAQFQALLQLNTGTENGDILFNYNDTDFGNTAFNFGKSAEVGISSANSPAGGAPTGQAIVPFSTNFPFAGNRQAIRFSTQSTYPASSLSSDAFGYKAFRSPFESRSDLEPGNTDVTIAYTPAFNDAAGQTVSISVPNHPNTFNFYGTTYSGQITTTTNGLAQFNGSTTSPLNTDLVSTPTPATIASLWDDWIGQSGSQARVLGRLVNVDGDDDDEFLIIEWSQVQNNNFTGGPSNSSPATFQTILELNTGTDPGEIYFNYFDTTVTLTPPQPATPNTSFNNGASASVGIKDAGTNAQRRLIVQSSGSSNNDILANQRGIVIANTESTPATVNITVNNVPPTINAGGDATITEGSVLSRNITITDPGLGDTFNVGTLGKVNWGDGVIENLPALAVGTRDFTLSHQYADNGTYAVVISKFNDDDSGVAPNVGFNVTVTNVVPTLQPIRNIAIRPLQTLNYQLADNFISDPGFTFPPAGTVETFVATINWGDGTPNTVVNINNAATGFTSAALSSPTTAKLLLNHNYPGVGQFTVTVTVVDDDGGTAQRTFLVGVGSAKTYAIGADAGAAPLVRVFDSRFRQEIYSFEAYSNEFRGGVRVATGDVNGDGLADFVTAAGPSGGPHIKVFSGFNGAEIASFYAYGATFSGGVNIAVADVNNDGFADIVTGAGASGGPHVRVFSGKSVTAGNYGDVLYNFYAYSPTFFGGVSVAAGDVNGDGKADITTGAGAGGGPHVRVFSGADLSQLYSFYAYDQNFSGGVYVAMGDVDNDGRSDIVTGPGLTGGPHVRIFRGSNGSLLKEFFAFDPGVAGADPYSGDAIWSSGVRVAVSDIGDPFSNFTGDGFGDIIAAPGSGRPPRVRLIDGKSVSILDESLIFREEFLGGEWVGGN